MTFKEPLRKSTSNTVVEIIFTKHETELVYADGTAETIPRERFEFDATASKNN